MVKYGHLLLYYGVLVKPEIVVPVCGFRHTSYTHTWKGLSEVWFSEGKQVAGKGILSHLVHPCPL